MKGRLARLGHGRNGRTVADANPPPIAISAEVHKRSRPWRSTAFQLAWSTAVARTRPMSHWLTVQASAAAARRAAGDHTSEISGEDIERGFVQALGGLHHREIGLVGRFGDERLGDFLAVVDIGLRHEAI